MTVMVPNYFGLPYSIIRSGLYKLLPPCARDLLLFLWHESERHTSRELRRTDEQIIAAVGLSRRSCSTARKSLLEHGLIQCTLDRDGKNLYVLCDPVTREPWPGDPREPVKYVPVSSRPGGVSMSAGQEIFPPVAQQNLPIARQDLPPAQQDLQGAQQKLQGTVSEVGAAQEFARSPYIPNKTFVEEKFLKNKFLEGESAIDVVVPVGDEGQGAAGGSGGGRLTPPASHVEEAFDEDKGTAASAKKRPPENSRDDYDLQERAAIQKADAGETATAPKRSEYARSVKRNRELRVLLLGATLPFCGGPKPGEDLSKHGVQLDFGPITSKAVVNEESTVAERARMTKRRP